MPQRDALPFLAFPILAGAMVLTEPGNASALPANIWQDVRTLDIDCSISGGTAAQRAAICQRLIATAAANAPIPVRAADTSAPATPGHARLHMKGHISGDGTALGFTGSVHSEVAALRSDETQRSAAYPVKLVLGKRTIKPDGPLHAALSELLPWRKISPARRAAPPRQY